MGFLDDGMKQMLEGKFGQKLEQAAQATVDLKGTIDRAITVSERGIALGERLEPLLQDLVRELRSRQ